MKKLFLLFLVPFALFAEPKAVDFEELNLGSDPQFVESSSVVVDDYSIEPSPMHNEEFAKIQLGCRNPGAVNNQIPPVNITAFCKMRGYMMKRC